MIQAAHRACQAAATLEARNAGRPDLIEMRIDWSRKLLNAQLSLCTTGKERKKVLDDALTEARARADRIAKLPHGATTGLVTAQVEYAVAETEYRLAVEK